ncbi:MAG: hypothetical protein LBI42_15805 [Chitinispirillales bacterium]|jgi:hypothetical protein|nr:hypothetical protein [Chitinispirillales bacterium]
MKLSIQQFKYGWTLLTFVFLNCGIIEAKTVDNIPLFEQKIIANEKKLIEMAEQKGRIIETSAVKKVLNISKGEFAHNRRDYVHGLSVIGCGPLSWEGYNGFIKEPLIVELLVCALSDDEQRVREFAFTMLTTAAEWRLLPPFKSDIQKALAKHHIPDPVQILCLLNLTETEKKHWLKSEHIHTLAQRAALGDVKSEDSLITLFKEAENNLQLENRGRDLAFVGSKKCRIALVKGLETDIFQEHPSSGMIDHGIGVVIKGLSRLHPDELLLTKEFRSVEKPVYDKETGIYDDTNVKDYLTKLAKWVQSTYGVKVKLPKEDSFIRKINPNAVRVVPYYDMFPFERPQ